MSSKVFGIGIGKTGTTSLAGALRKLGLRGVDHPPPQQLTKFMQGHYDFGTDMPFSTDFEQMDKTFPGSKFILTVRPIADEWLRSVEAQHEKPVPDWGMLYRMQMYGIPHFDPLNQFKIKSEHEGRVISYFRNRPDDLLVLNIVGGDGWEPLCSFFNKPIPMEPFPHLNKGP